jgi:hypothetical protein
MVTLQCRCALNIIVCWKHSSAVEVHPLELPAGKLQSQRHGSEPCWLPLHGTQPVESCLLRMQLNGACQTWHCRAALQALRQRDTSHHNTCTAYDTSAGEQSIIALGVIPRFNQKGQDSIKVSCIACNNHSFALSAEPSRHHAINEQFNPVCSTMQ